MDAATLLTMTVSPSQKNNAVGSASLNQEPSNELSAFNQLINDALDKPNLLETKLNETATALLTEMGDSLDVIGSEELSKLTNYDALMTSFEQLFEAIPFNQGFMERDLLQNDDVLALLNQWPQPIQQLLTDFIQSRSSFEQIFTQTEKGSQEQVGLLLLATYQLEENGQLPEQFKQTEFLKLLQQHIKESFKLELPELAPKASLLVKELGQRLEKLKDGDNVKAKAMALNSLGQAKQPSNVELRQIIQKVLYSNQPIDSKVQMASSSSLKETITALTQSSQTQPAMNEDIFNQLVNTSIKDGGSVNRIQQYVLTLQQPSGASLPEDQVLNQLKKIMNQSKLTSLPNGTNQLLIKLNPAHLGSLSIKLTETNGEMIARIIASTVTAKDVIESNLHSLRHVFTTQNINIEKFEIQYQDDSHFKDTNKDNNQQQDNHKQSHKDSNNQPDNEDSTNVSSFKDELFNIMV